MNTTLPALFSVVLMAGASAGEPDPSLSFERGAQFENVEGNFPAALEQYRLAAVDKAAYALRVEAEVAVARCLMKMGKPDEAKAALEGLSTWLKAARLRAPDDVPSSLEVNGRLYLPSAELPGDGRLEEAMRAIEAAGAGDRERLISAAISGMASTLSRNSGYIESGPVDPEVVKFAGVGMTLASGHDTIIVRETLEDSPARKAGIPAGSEILEVGGRSPFAIGGKLEDVVGAIRGPEGSVLQLTLKYPDETVHTLDLRRERLVMKRTPQADLLPLIGQTEANPWWVDQSAGIAGVALRDLKPDTAETLRKVLADLQEKTPIRGVILDLCDSRGGLPENASGIADLFLTQGVLHSVKTRSGMETRRADPAEILPGVPLAVLVWRGTSGGAESLAAALQDSGRATVMGERTHGCGELLEVRALEKGGALKTPVGEILRPSGKGMERREGMTVKDDWGVTPDRPSPVPFLAFELRRDPFPAVGNITENEGEKPKENMAEKRNSYIEAKKALIAMAAEFLKGTHGAR